MRFQITAVQMSRTTRRRCGKAYTEVIDTETQEDYDGVETPREAEVMYQRAWEKNHPGSHTDCKVVDVRRID